ncbi:MAG: RND family efflux transporter MFP subunit [Parcubacteria group bacterium GW2011_GWB1_41_4]|nr:MAG: RND family efflux transporter MFP subunit [Parcubacteria group bacterium GW2011_GWB1_41_4]
MRQGIFLKLAKKNKIIIFFILFALVSGLIVFNQANREPSLNLYTVGFGDIKQALSFTGKIKPGEEVDLSFEISGRVENVLQKTGDGVEVNQILATLDSSSALAELEKVKATLKSEEARLEELKRGSRLEEIEVYIAKVNAAKVNVDEARKSLVDKIHDAYTKSDDAIYNQVDQLFTDPKSQTPRLNIVPIDSQLKGDLESFRIVIGFALKSWNDSLINLSSSSDLDVFSLKAKENLDLLRNFLDKIALGVNAMTVGSGFSQTTIDGYKSGVSGARVNINLAISNLSASEEKFKVSLASLLLAGRELELAKSGISQEEIRAQEARGLQAKAGVSSAEVELSKTIIRSPISGIISQQSISVGEIATANKTIFTMISSSGFEIEANVTEIDIAKIEIGNVARVTLDAYGSDVEFIVKIFSIDPAETVIEGVSTYKTKFVFENKDDRIKSGMTANIEMELDLRQSVLIIPQRLIEQNGDARIVTVYEFGKIQQREVRLGQRGSDGSIEILEGLKAGDKIVLP